MRALRYLPFLILAAACSSADPVKSDDGSVLFPSLRLSGQILPKEGFGLLGAPPMDPLAEETEPPSRFFSLAIDFAMSYGHGEDTQTVPLGDRIEVDDRDFFGPTTLDVSSDLFYWTLWARLGGWTRGVVGFEGIAGAGLTVLTLEVEQGSISESIREEAGGPLLGGRFTVRPIPELSLYAQATSIAFLGAATSGSMAEWEFALLAEPIPGLGLLGGWRAWIYRGDRSDESDRRLDYSGPMIGLQIRF